MHPAKKNTETENEQHHAELKNSRVTLLRWKFIESQKMLDNDIKKRL